jgi:Zinc finger, C3HC4 type (RING finger)
MSPMEDNEDLPDDGSAEINRAAAEDETTPSTAEDLRRDGDTNVADGSDIDRSKRGEDNYNTTNLSPADDGGGDNMRGSDDIEEEDQDGGKSSADKVNENANSGGEEHQNGEAKTGLGSDSGSQSGSALRKTHPPGRPVLPTGTIQLDVAMIESQVVCTLCEGLFREPYTTIKCFHTFCKSCLATALHSTWKRRNYNCCPTCGEYLGGDALLSSLALPDRTLETLIDKVLFREIAQQDRQAEAAFYASQGIERKQQFMSPSEGLLSSSDHEKKRRLAYEISRPRSKRGPVLSSGPVITFQLAPHHDDGAKTGKDVGKEQEEEAAAQQQPAGEVPPPLRLPFLQTQGCIVMGQLKKYLKRKLGIVGREFDILCNSLPLGNDYSVTFVHRTIWTSEEEKLKLTYRFAVDGASIGVGKES